MVVGHQGLHGHRRRRRSPYLGRIPNTNPLQHYSRGSRGPFPSSPLITSQLHVRRHHDGIGRLSAADADGPERRLLRERRVAGTMTAVTWFRRRPRNPRAWASAVVRGPGDDPSLSDEQLIARRTAWFFAYAAQKNVFASDAGGPYSCPCCGHVTLSERGGYEICPECGWEDDGQDDHDAHVVRGGPNGRESLSAAREAYLQRGGALLPHQPPAEAT
jgi:hypothetical protein